MPSCEFVSGEPVGRRVPAVEQPRLGQRERADTDRRDSRPTVGSGPQCRENSGRRRLQRVVPPWHHDEVGPLDGVQPVIDGQAHRTGLDGRFVTGDDDPVSRAAVR